MLRRILFSAIFVVGGITTLLILLTLHRFGQAEAGMSDGAVSSSGVSDSVTISIICGYFFVSALGIAISGTKPALWLWAAFAHALLVINYALIFISAKNDDPEGYKWPSEVVTLAMVVAFYFSPWLVAWGVVLAKAKSGKSVVRVQNQAAEQNQPSQKYADEIKQKY